MSSSDDEAPSPETGACSSKDPPPPLQSESADDEDQLPVSKRKSGYRRPRVEWQEVMRHVKGDEALMGEDAMKLQIIQASNQIMEESRMVRLPGHVPASTDVGLWKLKSSNTMDNGLTHVAVYNCPMAYRFACQCQIKISDGPLQLEDCLSDCG